MEETFEPPFYLRRNIEVKFSPMTAEWQITGKSTPSRNDVHAYMTYGTSRANAYRILEDTLNLRDIRIYDTVEDADGKQKRVLNKKKRPPSPSRNSRPLRMRSRTGCGKTLIAVRTWWKKSITSCSTVPVLVSTMAPTSALAA